MLDLAIKITDFFISTYPRFFSAIIIFSLVLFIIYYKLFHMKNFETRITDSNNELKIESQNKITELTSLLGKKNEEIQNLNKTINELKYAVLCSQQDAKRLEDKVQHITDRFEDKLENTKELHNLNLKTYPQGGNNG